MSRISNKAIIFVFSGMLMLLLTLAVSCSKQGGSSQMDLSQAIDRIRPSIVQIIFSASDISPDMSAKLGGITWINQAIGTGFIVNSDGYVITARHVIKDGLQNVQSFPAKTKRLYIGFALENTENIRGSFTLVDFEIIEEDQLHDLALLKLKRNPFKGEVKSGFSDKGKEIPVLYGTSDLNSNRPKDGVAVGISGYPLNQTVLVTNGGIMATSWSFRLKEVSVPGAPEYFKTLDIADSYLADVNVNPGDSGSPVYLASDGSVIGICVAFLKCNLQNSQGNVDLTYNSGLAVVVPTRYISDLLNKHNPKTN